MVARTGRTAPTRNAIPTLNRVTQAARVVKSLIPYSMRRWAPRRRPVQPPHCRRRSVRSSCRRPSPRTMRRSRPLLVGRHRQALRLVADERSLGFDVGESFPSFAPNATRAPTKALDDHHGVSGSRFDVGSGQTESHTCDGDDAVVHPGDPAADLRLRLSPAREGEGHVVSLRWHANSAIPTRLALRVRTRISLSTCGGCL